MTIHVVEQGETINSIAEQYAVTAESLILDNELPNPENLVVGQSIVVRFPQIVHNVAEEDTLASIAQAYEVTITQIYQNNPWIAAEGIISPGDTVIISYEEEGILGSVLMNGYCYPFIDRTVLRKTLPFLTYLSIFTYGFNAEGDLVPIEDDELIAIAQEFGVGPVMMLAPMTPEQEFNSQIAHDMFVNVEGRNRLIDNIIANMQAKGYVGLDIDFEFVLPEDKELFIQFITDTVSRLSEVGLFTMVALAPKISGEMTGLLYEAHDYPAIGSVAQDVLLMTYEWGYMFGPPMATAPLDNVRTVLEYGVSVIAPDKILMGIPNYAYDWPLPFVAEETVAEALSNQEAIERAAQYGVTIQFDEEAQSPFYFYTDLAGVEHVVWFDDARSMDAKIRLIPEYGLEGGGVWQIMNFFPALWMVINELFIIDKI